MKSVSNFVFLLVINLVLILFTCLLIEGTFRVLGIPYSRNGYIPNENSFARFDPELGWSYLPDKSSIHKVGGEKIKKSVHFDRTALRVPHPGFQFDGQRPSILFIGGSFTMGHGLLYEESFVGQFDSFDEVEYQVVNLGVQGYGTDQALLALKRHMPNFNAKIVIYTFIEDHILRNGNYDRRMLIPTARFLGTKPQFTLSSDNELRLLRKPKLYGDYVNSYLIDFLKMRLGTIMRTFPPFPEELTKAIIQEMKKYSNEHGALFVILNWRWTDKDYFQLFKEIDVEVIDTIEDSPEGWAKMVLLEGTHPDARASEHVAKLLYKYFRAKNLLKIEIEN